jgi:predicted NBD/HSP70 family sugar kinase
MTWQEQTFEGSLFDVRAHGHWRLDAGFRPLALGVRAYRRALAAWGLHMPFRISLEQSPADVARLDLEIFPPGADREADNLRYVTAMLRTLLWSRGGWRISLSGPRELCAQVAALVRTDPRLAFERDIMAKAYLRPLEVQEFAVLPEPCQSPRALGGHLRGCRLGFDLGASDFKVAAVKDGAVVYSAERPWTPREAADPDYHFRLLDEGLRLAAGFLPRVDAIGGSSAGIIVDNEVRVSSLFRAVPAPRFEAEVRPFFQRLRAAWGVPVTVLNDGDVTALAGGLSLEQHGILGIALGSSEAVGFLDGHGQLTGWLNELAFAPIDANPAAGADDWAQAPGVGAAYLSQQAVLRLAPRAGLPLAAGLDPAQTLAAVQALLEKGDPAAAEVFATIGAYLGYSLPWYAEFYPLRSALILGRVTSGSGGAIILETARNILAEQFPELGDRITVALPDERSRRVGQAVAAASLPRLDQR